MSDDTDYQIFKMSEKIQELERRLNELENNIALRVQKLVNDLNDLIQRSHGEVIKLFDNRDDLFRRFKSEIDNVIHAVGPLVRENHLKEEYKIEEMFHKAELKQKLLV